MGNVKKIEEISQADVSDKKTPAVKLVDKSQAKGLDKQEYLNARKRVKGGIKGIIIAVVVIVALVMGGLVYSAVAPTPAGQVKITTSSSSLVGKHYGDVQTLLQKDGFTNIELRPEGDLIAGVLHDDGDVETVSIDGKTSFSSGQTFDASAKVVIAYHSYPNKSSNTNNASASGASSTANANTNAASANASSSTSANASVTTNSTAK